MDGFEFMFHHHMMYYFVDNINSYMFDLLFDGIVMFVSTSATIIGAIWIWRSIRKENNLKNEAGN